MSGNINPEKLKQKIRDEVSTVMDPDLGLSLTDLGLIYEINLDENNNVSIKMSLTSMGCPLGPQLQAAVHGAAARVNEVNKVQVDIVWSPPWNPKTMASEEARLELGIY